MSTSNVCWGIEIGAASIKAIKLENMGDAGVRVIDFAVIQHPKPLSTPGVDANDVLRVSLGQLTSSFDLSKAAIAVSVPGHSAFARFAKLPPVEPKKVPDIVKFEAMQQIPFPLEQVEWDYQTFVTPDSPDIEVGIFAITRDKVMERLNMLQDVGLTPNFVVLSPIAAYNALAYDRQFDTTTPGTIIVDVGTTSTDLVIATPGRVWVRTFPIGGHQFTEALVNQFQLSYPKAEKLKREAEDTKHARQVFQAMRPIFTDLAQDIQRSIGYYQSLNKDANLTRLIGVGSTFELPGLRKYLKQQLSLDVHRIEDFKRLTVPTERTAEFNAVALNMCTCYGLALQGLGLNTVGGNLMPVAVVRESLWREKVPWFGLAAGLAVAGSAAFFLRPYMDSMAIKDKLPAPIIQTVVNRANSLKSEAQQAGVLEAGDPKLDAANAISLFESRDIYRQLNDDISAIFVAGNEKAPGWPAFKQATNPDGTPMADIPGSAFALDSFTSEYRPPAVANPMVDSSTEESSAAKDPMAEWNKYPRIECTLSVKTNQPEPRQFAEAVILDWLRKNSKRDGVVYELKFRERPIDVTDAARSADAGAATPKFGDASSNKGSSRTGALGADGMVDPRVIREMETDDDRRMRERADRAAGAVVGGGTTPKGRTQNAASGVEVDKIAPLIEPPSALGAPSTVRVSWTAVFIPKDAAGQNGEAK